MHEIVGRDGMIDRVPSRPRQSVKVSRGLSPPNLHQLSGWVKKGHAGNIGELLALP